MVADEESEESSVEEVSDPVVDPGSDDSGDQAMTARPVPDVRYCNRCKTVSYLRKGGCSNPC